ncbi:hypothetical protein IFM89_031852 [Coptis chinensis]|uniref:Uncharacterized protein n=1 Tax=Coptis chinensis TaxID=261450 RepID=A0A835LF62_9MAGN|nr:hypothetical protein IFM89_031852 [Coptis chinensis]
MKVIWVPPINGQAETMFPPEYTSSYPIPKHTNSFGCLNNIILFSGLDEFGNEKRPAQAILDGHFAAGSLERAGEGIIRDGLGAYGERILGSSSEFVQSNVSKYFSDPQYYFQVNGQYVRNKLKVILFPFLHRGHWTRITEPVGGRLSYKPPSFDINAPDLYTPLMSYGTYVVLAGFTLALLESKTA